METALVRLSMETVLVFSIGQLYWKTLELQAYSRALLGVALYKVTIVM